MNFRELLKNINVLNIILIVSLIVSAWYIASSLTGAKINYAPPAVKTEPLEEEELGSGQPPSSLDFLVIAEQNPYHPERKIPVEKKKEDAPPPPPPKPEIALYGTAVAGDESLAYIEDKKAPRTSPGRGKRLTVLRKGDSVSGFVLKEITPDKIVLARGNETMTVFVYDQKSKTRESSETMPGGPSGPAQQGRPIMPPAFR